MSGVLTPVPATGRLLDFAPVFRNRKAMGFVLGYGAHCFELYGIRTWIVAFWTFVSMRHSDAPLLTPVVVSVAFSLLAMPASILGNEFALRFGRHRAITAVMLCSAAVALSIGLLADKSPWLLLPLVLPGVDGVELIRLLRSHTHAGVLVVSGRVAQVLRQKLRVLGIVVDDGDRGGQRGSGIGHGAWCGRFGRFQVGAPRS